MQERGLERPSTDIAGEAGPRSISSRVRRYNVSGIDGFGDVQVFGSDDRDRADAMYRQMLEDLEHVQYHDRGTAS